MTSLAANQFMDHGFRTSQAVNIYHGRLNNDHTASLSQEGGHFLIHRTRQVISAVATKILIIPSFFFLLNV